MITSSSNSQIKQLIRLQKSSKARKESGVFLVEGEKMVKEAYERKLIHKVYVSEKYYNKNKELSFISEMPFEIVQDSIFQSISDTVTPQGVLATIYLPEYRLEELVKKENAAFLILDDIQDPGNLGTMMRTLEGAGLTGLIMSKGTVDIFNPKVVRATMGAMYRVPFIYVEDLQSCLISLKAAGIKLFSADLEGRNQYDQEDYTGKIGFLIGNEGNGLKKEISNLADQKIRIPMSGELESLNAAISAGILMYECNRQRRNLLEM